MTELQITYRPVDDLVPYARNARTHSPEQIDRIAASIREYGWTNPILTDGEAGIIAGHGRLAAARKLGLKTVPTIELSGLSEAQKRAYILADNRLALDAGWDNEMLTLELGGLKDAGVDLELTGFSDEELDELLATPAESADGDEDGAPEPQEDPVSKRGDVWILGAHRVMCGDSCSADDISKLFGSTGGGTPTVSLYLTDPPYNVAYEGGTKDALTIQNDNMEDGQFRQFLVDAFSMADTILEPGGVFYIWYCEAETANFIGACNDVGWKVYQNLIWLKNSMVLGHLDYHKKHEPCLYGWKKGGKHPWYSDRSQTTIIECDKPNRNGVHPTMKPVELFRYLMQNSSRKGDVVYDSFGGSGTTLIASEETGRVARLMELDPRYVDVIVKRWQELTGKEATLEETGATFNSLQH